MATELDVICIGRSSVDLYGGQVGGRLEDMMSFDKYIGGSPTNISVGTARLGLRSALITRVGDEHMGRFIKEQLTAEGVDISHVITDKERLSALVLLGIRNETQFPLIFYRENCADMAICEDDIDADFITSAKAVLVTGTHFSTPSVSAASFKVMKLARQANRKVAFDIDYRPNLWALGGHGDGEERFAESAFVSDHLKTILPHCDLIVGTEEEWQIAGGQLDTLDALREARTLSDAIFVCKRGPLGCVIFEDEIKGWDDGVSVPVQAIEVFNVLGAGDGFMSGFLRGWLRDEPLERCAAYANGCGALAVSRHGCAPAYPSFEELTHLLTKGSSHHALRLDHKLEQLHWSTTRKKRYDELIAFAFDHRVQFEAMAKKAGRNDNAIQAFKHLALEASLQATNGRGGAGVLIDDRLGRSALHKASDHDLWIGRPIEVSGTFPLEFEEAPSLGARLATWPENHCVKVLAPLRLDDDNDLIAYHEDMLVRLADACRQTRHELLLEIITERDSKPTAPEQILQLMTRLYDLNICPDWWKLEPVNDTQFWHQASQIVASRDPHLQGIIILGKNMPTEELASVFKAGRGAKFVKGFAIGRTIFGDVAKKWMSDNITDEQAVQQMAETFATLIQLWDEAGEMK